jgi:hypothetical protein
MILTNNFHFLTSGSQNQGENNYRCSIGVGCLYQVPILVGYTEMIMSIYCNIYMHVCMSVLRLLVWRFFRCVYGDENRQILFGGGGQ